MNAPPILPASVYYDMPADEYHQIDALGSSDVKALMRSPAHFVARRQEPREATDAQQLGTAIHVGVLEPHRFDHAVAVAPVVDRRTKEGKAAWSVFVEQSVGRLILTQDQHDLARRVIDAVHAHPAARALLDGGASEVSLQWRDNATGAPCKARIDRLRPDGGIVDLKTTVDASPRGFARAIGQFGYAAQAAHYLAGAQAVLGQAPYFAFVAVEKEPPYAVAAYVLDADSVATARDRVQAAYARYVECLQAQEWPAYSGLIETITAPAWA